MERLLRKGRRHLLMGVACGLGMMALAASEARAASLIITVSESVGGASVTIDDNGALDTNLAIGVIDVAAGSLNGNLNNYTFSGLSASSNSPGDPTQAFLKQLGTAVLNDGGTGSVTVLASDVDYNIPGAGPGSLFSSASNTYTNAANGDSQGFTSWFNPSNALGATEVTSPTVTLTALTPPNPNSHSGDAATTPVTLTVPYGLTNSTTLTLTVAGSSNQFTGATTITASAIPEPASLALLASAVPFTLLGAYRRRIAAK
jgi:hypothetical protein